MEQLALILCTELLTMSLNFFHGLHVSQITVPRDKRKRRGVTIFFSEPCVYVDTDDSFLCINSLKLRSIQNYSEDNYVFHFLPNLKSCEVLPASKFTLILTIASDTPIPLNYD